MIREKVVITPLIEGGLAWLLGLFIAQWLNLPWPVIFMLMGLAVAAIYLYQDERRARKMATLALVGALGLARVALFQPTFDETSISFYNDSAAPVTVMGVVMAESDVRDYQVNLRLQVETMHLADQTRAVHGLLLVRAPRYPLYQYGDRLMVTGQLETPPIFEDFSYKDYLARQGVYSLMRRPQLKLLAQQQGNLFWATMLAYKQHASTTINRILPEPHASLLNGILLGVDSNIPPQLYQDFNTTGTSHIIVISGSNISIVALILLWLGQRLWGRQTAPIVTLFGLVGYTFLVGAEASVSRAAVMGGLVVFGLWLGRPGMALNSLMASAIFLTLINPLYLQDVGFQLSFMATLGLITLMSPLERLATYLTGRFLPATPASFLLALLNEFLLMTLAAQIITTPLIVYHFGRLSLISLLTNLLIAPAQPFIMTLGGLATGAGLLWLSLGELLGWLAWLPLTWTITLVEWTARWPHASVELGRLPLGLMLLWYGVIAAAVWWANQPSEAAAWSKQLPTWGNTTNRLIFGGAVAGLILVGTVITSRPDGYLHVAFLDVGQGDAILLTLPDGRQILIDGGPSATQLQWRLGQEMPFWDKSLDLVINTHTDADHLGGLVSLLDRYSVGQILVTDMGGRTSLYQAWQQELHTLSYTPTVAHAGMVLPLQPNITATILSPGAASEHETATNNHSVVLRLEMGQVSFLFTGDIEATVEEKLVQSGEILESTVLKSPHHGSNTSSSEPFLQAVKPRIVVISVGVDNPFKHPRPETLARYAEHDMTVLRTDEQGTVELVTDGQRLWRN
jgi:competence protein ComEC